VKLRTLYITGLVALAAIGTVVVLAYLTIWQWIYGLLLCLSTLLGIILALVALIVWQRTRTKKSLALSRVRKGLFLGSVFLLLQVTYFPITQGLRDVEVKRAQDFINALVPRLEEYKRLHNEYPASVDSVLTGDEKVPWLLQLSEDFYYDNRQYYVRQGETYRFRFFVPAGLFGFYYEYCCGVDGVWMVID
jgi:hypothetical protein